MHDKNENIIKETIQSHNYKYQRQIRQQNGLGRFIIAI